MNEIEQIQIGDDFKSKVESVEEFLLSLPQIHVDPVHRFAEGLYCRQLTMPKDTLWTSRVHKHENFAFIMTGECTVTSEDGSIRYKAPYMFKTLAGTKRLLQIHEECTWITVHALPDNIDQSDIESIENYYACNTLQEYEQLQIQNNAVLEVAS